MHKVDDVATKLLGMPYESLDEVARKVARHVAKRTHIVRNLARDVGARPTLGQRAADAVASFGGSYDCEINLKAELEIMLLHQKLDDLRETQWAGLLALQQEQLKLLSSLIDRKVLAA